MLYFLVESSEIQPVLTGKLRSFFEHFTNTISKLGVVVLNLTEIDLSLISTSYFPPKYVDGIVQNPVKYAIIGENRFAYGEALKFLSEAKKLLTKIETVSDIPYKDYEVLCQVVDDILFIDTSCSSEEEIVKKETEELPIKDKHTSCIVHLGTEATNTSLKGFEHVFFNESEMIHSETVEKKLKILFNKTFISEN